MSICYLFHDQRVQGNVLKDHSHHHEHAQEGEKGGILHLCVEGTDEKSKTSEKLTDDDPGFPFAIGY